MRLKQPTGWFAAGDAMLQALHLLSDGAFKLFAYLSLIADRQTGRLRISQPDLARALGKSRNSIRVYLEELTSRGFCLIKPAPNQHQAGEIEIEDAFWPYHKDAVPFAVQDRAISESAYVEQVRSLLLQYPIVCCSFGTADQKIAADLFRDGVPLEQLERALLLGLTRKYISSLNSTASGVIYSLRYFLPLLDEVAHTEVTEDYWGYLRRRLQNLDAAWLDRQRQSPTQASASTTHPGR
jgi:hypothetical protein